MFRRQFKGARDLAAMQALVAERTRVMGPCTNLHPGDIAHRIYSGLRRFDLDEVVPVYLDDVGLAGFGIIWPDDHAFDAVTRIGLADGDRMAIVSEIAGFEASDGRIETDVIGTDTCLTSVLSDVGFTPGRAEYVFAQQRLDTPITAPCHDFVVRTVSTGDAEQLALVHSGAFGGGWSAANYEERMRKPGYDQDNEIVAVDANGAFMGFTVTWYDEMNKVGYFEPVGVHRDFHRRGVGSALLGAGMEQMRNAGMETATVWHAAAEDRAVAFYESNGFTMVNPVRRWVRP